MGQERGQGPRGGCGQKSGPQEEVMHANHSVQEDRGLASVDLGTRHAGGRAGAMEGPATSVGSGVALPRLAGASGPHHLCPLVSLAWKRGICQWN